MARDEDVTAAAVGSDILCANDVLRTAQVCCNVPDPIHEIVEQIGQTDLALLAVFVTAEADFETVVAQLSTRYPTTDVVACTTAGEIGKHGYEEGQIIAIGFPKSDFASTSIVVEDLTDFDAQELSDQIAQKRVALQERHENKGYGVALLMVDGLSLREDTLTATISPALRDTPLLGASAGDGTRFTETLIAINGRVLRNAAVLNIIRAAPKIKVFTLDHLVPTDQKMVVTEADPERRIVKAINAEPAAREYARIVGKDPEQLDKFTFASHPVVVRLGGKHHVRAIQQVNDAGELVFFSAIDEGMVLTVATAENMVDHLNATMADLSRNGSPDHIIGFDCILRRIEAEQTQVTRELSNIMAAHKVMGLSTYGEQIGPLHVNHTMTGVAFYKNS